MRPLRRLRSFTLALLAAATLAVPAYGQDFACLASDIDVRVAFDDSLSAGSRYRVLYPDSTRTAHNSIDTSLRTALGALRPDFAPIGALFHVEFDCAEWLDLSALGGEVRVDTVPVPVVDSTAIDSLSAELSTYEQEIVRLSIVIDSLLAELGSEEPPPAPELPVATSLRIIDEGGGARHAAAWNGPVEQAWRVTLGGQPQTGAVSTNGSGAYWYDFGRLISGEVCVQAVGSGGTLGTAACVTVGGETPGEPGTPTVVGLRVLPVSFSIELPAGEGEVQQRPTSQRVYAVADLSDGLPYRCDATGTALEEVLLLSTSNGSASKPDSVAVRSGGKTLAGPCSIAWCVSDPSVATLSFDDGSTAAACAGGGDGGSFRLTWRGTEYPIEGGLP